jgi:para-aminobenzoate synthetase
VTTALAAFRRAADTHDRCFWLDGGGSRPWSGRRAIVGRLGDDDLSLTYDATRSEVVEHPSGRVVGDDVFAVLQEHQDGDPDTHWVGCFGYAARPDLPARSLSGVPDAVWMRTRDVEVFEEPG